MYVMFQSFWSLAELKNSKIIMVKVRLLRLFTYLEVFTHSEEVFSEHFHLLTFIRQSLFTEFKQR